MVPERLELEGFLTYQDRTVFDFSSDSLWAIDGENGAGKSALGDAITYVLYGVHRGGSERDERLLNKRSQDMQVVFDFWQDGRLYRVRRSLHKRVGRRGLITYEKERQAYEHVAIANGASTWRPLPQTQTAEGLRDRILDIVGFGCSTFTASVLLRQGEGDVFVNAK